VASPRIRIAPVAMLAVLASSACGGQVPLDDQVCPSLAVEPGQVSIVDARLGQAHPATLTLSNDCSRERALTLSVTLLDAPATVQLTPPDATVAPGQSTQAQLTWTPVDYQPVQASLRIESNDPDQALLTVPITLEVLFDQDGDGADAIEAGGTDCDDLDAARRPGATELNDGVDQDCDGLVDEDFVEPLDVVVTEVFAAADARRGDRQWIEVVNRSSRTVNLSGWQVRSGGTSLTVAPGAVLEPGARGLLARSSDPEVLGTDAPPTGLLEGTGLLTLDAGWALSLVAGTQDVVTVGGPDFAAERERASMQLDPTIDPAAGADEAAAWCASTTPFTSTEAATPSADNTWCPDVDHDGDGEPLATDCDDTDRDRRPGRMEVLDGVDQDCSGRADDLDLPADALVQVTDFIVDRSPEAGIGDFDNDGLPELVLVSRSSGFTASYNVDEWLRRSGPAEYGYVAWGDEHTWRDTQSVVAQARDVTGDGVDDAVTGYLHQGSGYPVVGVGVVAGGDRTWIVSDEAARWEDVQVTALDADGDGVSEILAAASDADDSAGRVWWMHVDGVSDLFVDIADVSTTWSGSRRSRAGVGLGGGDVDDDGYEDLLIRSSAVSDLSGVNLIAGGVELPGDGSLASAVDASVVGGTSQPGLLSAPRLGDLDGDGSVDLVVSDASTHRIWWDAGDLLTVGPRSADAELSLGATTACSTLLADLDGDGDDELVSGIFPLTGGGLIGLFAWDADALVEPFDETAWQAGVPRFDASEALGCWVAAGDLVEGGGTADLVIGAPGNDEAWIVRSE